MIDSPGAARLASPPNGPDQDREPTDAELLTRLNEHNEQAAFERLVRRHSPMVLGVCRRVLRDDHEAEDALQATFIILLRKAKSIARPELLANWLYGVAFRVARKARIKANRQRASENLAETAALPDPHSGPEWIEAKTVLDEELRQLPAKYRIPLVLCYLDGKTNIEAARLVDCPEGSIADRLARARAELRKRLMRRGMVLSAGIVALLMKEGQASAGVSEQLIGKILEGATDLAGLQAHVAAGIPSKLAGPGDGKIDSAADEAGGNSPARPDDIPASRRDRPRKRKLLCALLWSTVTLWIVIPIYELAGGDFVRKRGIFWPMNHAARSAIRSGLAITLDPARDTAWDRDAKDESPAPDSEVRLSSKSSSSSNDDERCKRCLGTNCGSDDRAQNRMTLRKSLWKWLFSRN